MNPAKEARPKRKQRKRYKEEKPGRSVFGKKQVFQICLLLFWTYYGLFLGCLDLKFFPHIAYCVY